MAKLSQDGVLFRELVLSAFDAYSLEFDGPSQGGAIGRIHERVAYQYPRIDRTTLEKFLPGGERLQSDTKQEQRAFIYLKPPDRGRPSLPILNVKCDFGGESPDVGIRLAIFLLDEGEQPVSIGFRFETPHGKGEHDYHHAQPISSFFNDGAHILHCPKWLPDQLPAFPLLAHTPVELLGCMLGSLYGPSGLRHVMEAGRHNSLIQHSVGELMKRLMRPEVVEEKERQVGGKGPKHRPKGRRG